MHRQNNHLDTRPTGGKIKYGGKGVGRTAGSHCAITNNVSLVQCVGRKIQPVRCQTGLYHRKCALPAERTYGSTMNLALRGKAKTATSGVLTCPPTSRARGASPPRCRRSLSLIDLSPAGIDREITTDLRSDGSSIRIGQVSDLAMERPVGASMPGEVGVWIGESSTENLAERAAEGVNKSATLICHLLAINAWRRRREEVAGLRTTVGELGQQIDHLHIQITVLRRLLRTENCRVEKLGSEVHHAKTQLEEAMLERDTLKIERAQLQNELKKLQDESVEQSVATENLRNELMTLNTQLRALDAQISRDHEKLSKLREDKRILVDKVSSAEAMIAEERQRAANAEATTEQFKEKLKAQENVIGRLQDDNRQICGDLKKMETQKATVEKRLRTSEVASRTLSLRAANLEMQLGDREAALRRIESAYNVQLNELTELRERMIRQSEEGGWSSRVLQIAGSVVRAPRAILRSLTFLSTNSGAY